MVIFSIAAWTERDFGAEFMEVLSARFEHFSSVPMFAFNNVSADFPCVANPLCGDRLHFAVVRCRKSSEGDSPTHILSPEDVAETETDTRRKTS